MARRTFLAGTAAGLATTAVAPVSTDARIKALAFDAFPIFDPRPIFAQADALFPGAGLSDEWRTRQFEYSWLRVAARRYADFWQVTEDALVFAARKLKLPLQPGDRGALMQACLALKPWPDVAPALDAMKASGYRLAMLSNFTPHMLDANIRSAGLDGRFEQLISTDAARTYKPDPHAYQLGVETLKLRREEILFVAFAGWDAAGARLFGYPTFWVNRLRSPLEELGASPDGSGTTLTDLAAFLATRVPR